jgi:hypothetical protein
LDRFSVHYTPTHGSWLSQGEIEIGIFSRQCLGSRRISDLRTILQESRAWNRRMNPIKINWKFAKPPVSSSATKRNTPSGQRPALVAVLKLSFDCYDPIYDSMTGAAGAAKVNMFVRQTWSAAGVSYLRIKGILAPSSEGRP